MTILKIGDIVVSLVDADYQLAGITYQALIKGEKYRVTQLFPSHWEYPVQLESLVDPGTFVYAKPNELELPDESIDTGKQLEGSKRYRISGYTPDLDGGFTSKAEAIHQCDSFEDALNHLRTIHSEHVECTYFSIQRGEWL